MPRHTSSMEPSPCTSAGKSRTWMPGKRRVRILTMSAMAAPRGEVTMPMRRGKRGSGRFRSAAKSPSAASDFPVELGEAVDFLFAEPLPIGMRGEAELRVLFVNQGADAVAVDALGLEEDFVAGAGGHGGDGEGAGVDSFLRRLQHAKHLG